jgi:hypothetical protein
MAEVDPAISQFLDSEDKSRAQARVINSTDADKKKAATSVDVGKDTGIDSGTIYGDYDQFMARRKRQLTDSIVNDDPVLQDYVNSHPMAANVSKDDWSNLSHFVQSVSRASPTTIPIAMALRSKGLWDAAGKVVEGTSEIWNTPLGGSDEDYNRLYQEMPWLPKDAIETLRKSRTLPGVAPMFDPFLMLKGADAINRLFETALTGGAILGGEAYKGAGGDEAWANRLVRDIYAGAQLGMVAGGALAPEAGIRAGAKMAGKPALKAALELSPEFQRLQDILTKSKEFVLSGEQPPKGMDPEIDKLIANGAKQELEEVKEQQKRADATQTKELSPELFERLVERAVKQDIQVSWDGVKRLYGDKEPEPGDGLLGDVPGIQKQWKNSITTGEPITMPKSHWLAKIDNKVWKELENSYRDRVTSMTKDEIEALQDPAVQATRPTEPRDLIGNIRAAAGLDPMFKGAAGDVSLEEKVEQVKAEKKTEVPPEEKELIEPGAITSKRIHEQYKRNRERIRERDQARKLEIERRKAKKEMTPEWTENKNKMRDEVTEGIDTRPDFKMNDFLQYGKVGDEVVGKIKINPETLWPHQREAIPKNFLSKDGVSPDQLGKIFGFQTGHDAMEALTQFYNEKGELGAKAWRNRVIEQETNRRMEERYGKFEENVLNEAREHVVNPDQFSQIHQEVLRLADMLGQQMTLTKEDFRAQAWERHNESTASRADLARILREVGRAGKEAEAAFLKDDIDGAYKARQQQAHLFAEAEFIKQFQRKIWKPLDRIVKRYNPAEVKTMPQEFLNHIQNLLAKIGRPSKRTSEQIQEAMSHQDQQSLESFADARNKKYLPQGFEEYEAEYMPTIVVPDFILDPDWSKTLDNMTVGEARAVHDALQSLVKNGRGDNKLFLQDREYDLKESVDEGVKTAEKLAEVKDKYNFKALDKTKELFQYVHAGLTQIESFFARLDLDNPRGFFSKNVFQPIIDAANYRDKLRKQFSERIRDLEKHNPGKGERQLDEAIPNKVFYNPRYFKRDAEGKVGIPPGGTQWLDLNGDNLRAVLLNVGNPSNMDILARGFKTTPENIMLWLHEHATEKDINWAQDVGKIFGDLQKMSDKMTMGMTGSVIPKVPLGKVQTKFGEKSGWYYPAIYDRTRAPIRADGTLEQPPPNTLIRTARGWERQRTGYAGPLDLHTNQMLSHINRRLSDLAFRPVIGEVSKLALHPDIQNAIRTHYGDVYANMIHPWLQDLVSQNGYQSKIAQAAANAGEAIRGNIVGTLIGYSTGTLTKHSFTSFVQSAWEVDKKEFVKAVRDLYQSNDEHMKSWNKFIMEGGKIGELDWSGSNEVQRRMQHWDETLGGAYETQLGKKSLRAKRLEAGSSWVGRVDQWISKVTWLAKYREEFANNIRKLDENGERLMTDEEAHTDAATLADVVVRKTHGTTSMAGKPEFMRSQNPVVKGLTSLYGFFNHIFNRYYQMAWKAGEIPAKAMRGEPVAGDVGRLSMDFMMYVGAPVAIEEWMDQTCKPTDGWGVCSAKWLANGIAAPVPVLREIAHAIITGHDPSFGIFTSGYHAVTDMVKDLDPKRWDRHHAGDIVQHANTLLGIATGLSTTQLGRWQKYITNLALGEDRAPKSIGEVGSVIRWGTTRTLEEEKKRKQRR